MRRSRAPWPAPQVTLLGELGVHFADVLDPGFGDADAGGEGTRAVVEVRSHEVPFEDGQRLGRLHSERLIARPGRLCGEALGSFYQRQGLALFSGADLASNTSAHPLILAQMMARSSQFC